MKELYKKLFMMTFRGPFHEFIKKCFTHRHQLVKMRECSTNLIKTNYDVPEWSVLGPIIFNKDIKELGLIPFQCRLLQYADNTVLVLSPWNYENSDCFLKRY